MTETSDCAGTVNMSISGWLANFTSTRFGPLARWQGRMHARLYQRFEGKRLVRWMGRPVFLLTVPGRTSGEPRSVMLMLVRDGDDVLVCGSNGGNPQLPNWYRNLRAAGQATVTIGRDTWLVRARELEGDERATAWHILCEAYPDFSTYDQLCERELPITVLRRVDATLDSGEHDRAFPSRRPRADPPAAPVSPRSPTSPPAR